MNRILVMNFFPAFVPPRSGGELRYYNLYNKLSRYYDVTLLSPTYNDSKEEVINHSNTFREYRIPKEDIHNETHYKINEENIGPEFSALVCCLVSKYHTRYHEVYLELYKEADIIIHEFPYMLQYDLYFGLDNKPRVYNSHNFESNLVKQMWSGPNASKYVEIIRENEKKLVKNCDVVFATSEEDKTSFVKEFGVSENKVFCAPNGVNIEDYEYKRTRNLEGNRHKAFFVGSAHPPNLEAVRFIIEELAPQNEAIDFYIAGNCGKNIECDLTNVYLLGLIDEQQKDELFTTADIALNPMFSGSGTNLKMIEYLSAGIPVISTSIGARGLDLIDGEHCCLADKDDFDYKLKSIINDSNYILKISENGKKHVNAVFSWDEISKRVNNTLNTHISNVTNNKKIKTLLVLNDFEVDKPSAGGEVRIYNLLYSLSQSYNIVFLCLNGENRFEKKQITESFWHISLPKTTEHIEYEREVNSKSWISANDIVAGLMVNKNVLFMKIVKAMYSLADAIILEHPYMVNSLKGFSGKPVIYESLNYEYGLKDALLASHPMYAELVSAAKQFEVDAVCISDNVICCAENEIESLQRLAQGKYFAKFDVVKNGVRIPSPKYDYGVLKSRWRKSIVTFVGSGHMPNVDAAAFIIRGLARELPEVVFVIIGSVCNAFETEAVADNVVLMGMLDEKYKEYILYSSDVAINPVNEGAGSNLKLAEYFAHKIPTVTSKFGARGYDIENLKHAVICDREKFADEIMNIINNSAAYEKMTENAYEYACNELSWESLAKVYEDILQGMFDKKKLLIVTYRFNEEPRGGAESFLLNIINNMVDTTKYRIDIASTDIGDISNVYHYSCAYTKDDNRAFGRKLGVNLYKFKVDEDNIEDKWEKCNKLYNNSAREGIELARRLVQYYDTPLLMGGWHYPETTESGTKIWSSDISDIFINGVNGITIEGYTSEHKIIETFVDDRPISKDDISGQFVLSYNDLNGKIFTIKMQGTTLRNQDPRTLGIYVGKIRVNNGLDHELDLTQNYIQNVRENYADELVTQMIYVAEKRDCEYEQLFYSSRGPVSKELESWLDNNIQKYDCVLGHSVPFNTIIIASEYCKKYSIPYIALPHYHMEDLFYHWKKYYEALRNANYVIAAPANAKELFFDKIGARSVVIPGGGMNSEEFESIISDGPVELEQLDMPYVLVLGRKSGAKNYEWVIEAADKVNELGNRIKLVIIGKDEDKKQIDSKNVLYLGEQSRTNVIYALQNCEFVVNMSESESFGIVILEAWLAGKTVIVNKKCAAFRELVEDNVNGILTNREELDIKIMNLLRMDEHDLLKMVENGRKKAQNYSWRGISNEIVKLIDDLI